MNAKYILRFDDICPTMDYSIWGQVKGILDKYKISPLIAVIPDNKDTHFKVCPENKNFWNEIRELQEKGWMIGLHGLTHEYTSRDSGILGISNNTEFAGINKDIQMEKIKKGVEIFDRKRINPDVFIAPSHSFDFNTLECLKKAGIFTISDGYLSNPYSYYGLHWIPCQIWDRVIQKNNGIYTVCYHFTSWNKEDLKAFQKNIEEHNEYIISPFAITEFPAIKINQLLYCQYMAKKNKVKKHIKKIIRR